MLKALVLNDTRGTGHVGCLMVMQELLRACHVSGIEVSQSFKTGTRFLNKMHYALTNCDLVIINGEGTMHHDQSAALLLAEAAEQVNRVGTPMVLINTVWQQNNILNQMLPLLSLTCARESFSAKSIAKMGCNVRVVPDLVFNYNPCDIFNYPRVPKESIVVLDDVRPDLSLLLARYAFKKRVPFIRMGSRPSLRSFDSILDWGIPFLLGGCKSQLKLEQLSVIRDAQIIITGRFHGACLAILAGRPFVSVSSNSYKIEGLLHDADLGEGAILLDDYLLSQDPMKALEFAVEKLLDMTSTENLILEYQARCCSYVSSARARISAMFSDIKAIGQ